MAQTLSLELIDGLRRIAAKKFQENGKSTADLFNKKFSPKLREYHALIAKTKAIRNELIDVANKNGLYLGNSYDKASGRNLGGLYFLPGHVYSGSDIVEEKLLALRLAVETGDDVKVAIKKIFGFEA